MLWTSPPTVFLQSTVPSVSADDICLQLVASSSYKCPLRRAIASFVQFKEDGDP